MGRTGKNILKLSEIVFKGNNSTEEQKSLWASIDAHAGTNNKNTKFISIRNDEKLK